jgi:hypothetical protein
MNAYELDENARQLGGLLEGRQDWRLETDGEGPHWLFGVDGEARLVITPEADGFRLYRADQDDDWNIPTIEGVEEWLGEHEHAGLSVTGEAWKGAAKELRRKNDKEGGAA